MSYIHHEFINKNVSRIAQGDIIEYCIRCCPQFQKCMSHFGHGDQLRVTDIFNIFMGFDYTDKLYNEQMVKICTINDTIDIQSVQIVEIKNKIDVQNVQIFEIENKIVDIGNNFHEYEQFFTKKFTELENKIKELSEHNKQLSQRLFVFENPSPPEPPEPPIILF